MSQDSLLYQRTEILLLQKVIKLYIASSERSLCELTALKLISSNCWHCRFPMLPVSALKYWPWGHLKPRPFSQTMKITTWPELILKLVPKASVFSMLHSITYIIFP